MSGPGLLRLPFGMLAALALVLPAGVAFVLLQIGLSSGSGGAIAVGLLVGAFWLMMLIHTARAVTRTGEPPTARTRK